MKHFFLISFIFISISFFAQSKETHGDRTIKYSIDLDRLKFEEQELNIEKDLKQLEGVQSCDVDALHYKLYISVFEPKENNKSIEIDDIKIVLANNNVEIKNYTQEVIK
ncbi:MAG: hypothetical protein N4A35_08525 [Flavobacteriales bacterium]|jgi:hypothetical protein|nr:hypothetical protein [Flavobacteriales bacterium]